MVTQAKRIDFRVHFEREVLSFPLLLIAKNPSQRSILLVSILGKVLAQLCNEIFFGVRRDETRFDSINTELR